MSGSIPLWIQYIAIFGTILAFLAGVVKFILNWDRKEFLEFFKLTIGGKRSESLFQSKEFSPTCYNSEKIYLHDKPYSIESIRLTSGIEIKEYYTSEPFEIKPFAKNLLFVGWGVLKEEKRYLGSLMDQGDIGQVFFLDKDKNEISHIPISLPATEHESCLKLADMRHSVSGDPPDDLVEAVGLITRAKVDYIPWEDTCGEGFCNIWVSSIEVTSKKTRYIKFKTQKGSMHITNIIAIRSLWRSEGRTLRKRDKEKTKELKPEDIFKKYESKANERVKEAEKLKGENASKIFEEAAYLYTDEKKRKDILQKVGLNLIEEIEETNRTEKDFEKKQETSGNATKIYGEGSVARSKPNSSGIGSQETKNFARVADTARISFLAAIYLYQAECLAKEDYYKKILHNIVPLAEQFVKHDPPYLKEAFEQWHRIGWISLMYADQAVTREGVIDATNNAYDFYIKKIVEAILHLRNPSCSDIDYAIEMCKKMQRCYGEKRIDVPKVTELNEKLTALERTKEQFDKRSKIK